ITAPDDAVVEAQHSDHGRGRGGIDFSVQVSHRLVIKLGQELPARVTLAGRVLDPDGTPLPDALVVARFDADNPARELAQLMPGDRAVSDEEGRFTLDVDEGSYTVIASATGFAAALAREVRAPRKDLELRLGRGVALFGRVTDEGGAPIPSFVVIVARPQGALAREIVTVEPTLDPNGEYEIPTLPQGRFLVTVIAQGYAMAPDRSVELKDKPVEASFALGRGGRIRGVVVDGKSREALQRARVSLEGHYLGTGEVPLLASATTDEHGRFEIGGVSTGPQSIFAAASDHHARVLAGLSVPAGGVLDVTVELTPLEEGETPTIELAGIGAVLSAKDDVLVIGEIVTGGGAAEAGLVPGDAIIAIEGVPVAEIGFAGAVQRIRGPEGSSVTLTIRKGTGDTLTLEVLRRRVRAP
ncbi:MAG TPA: carboxypeptidase regulatory-like domain-containing protein, partial [Polyangiaceae bacterium]|nr:carboxypeptidase regulatory-like domain-containing protein [Polyangiaceae bacterium]